MLAIALSVPEGVTPCWTQAAGAGGGDWVAGRMGSLQQDAGRQHFLLDGVPPGAHLDVRVLLLDAELRAYARVPYTRVLTPQGGKAFVVVTADCQLFNP